VRGSATAAAQPRTRSLVGTLDAGDQAPRSVNCNAPSKVFIVYLPAPYPEQLEQSW
jgi:hypothetical protein